MRSIDVVEVNRGVRLVQVGNVITMFVDQTERISCHSPKYQASLTYLGTVSIGEGGAGCSN